MDRKEALVSEKDPDEQPPASDGRIVEHPFEVRLKARAFFLKGLPISRVSEILAVPRKTLFRWAKRGRWIDKREEIRRCVEKQELQRVVVEAALELRNTGQLLNETQRILETALYREVLDKDKKPTGQHVLRGLGDFKFNDEGLLRLLLMLTQRRDEHLKMTLDLLGGFNPKVSPEKLKLPVAGKLEAETEDEKEEEDNEPEP